MRFQHKKLLSIYIHILDTSRAHEDNRHFHLKENQPELLQDITNLHCYSNSNADNKVSCANITNIKVDVILSDVKTLKHSSCVDIIIIIIIRLVFCWMM